MSYNAASPIVRNCVVVGNGNGNTDGGGALFRNSEALIEDTVFCQNVGRDGGAIFTDGANEYWELRGCTFEGNQAGRIGGAISTSDDVGGTALIDRCTFRGNSAPDALNGLAGAIGVRLLAEKADDGVEADDPSFSLVVTNSLFFDNSAARSGGAVAAGLSTATTLDNCTFADNRAYEGGAIWVLSDSQTTICNSILFDDDATGDGEEILRELGGAGSLTLDCVIRPTGSVMGSGGTYSETNTITADPLFCDKANQVYQVAEASPAVDSGGSGCGPQTAYDLAGLGRVNGTIDRGAYENYQDCGHPVFAPQCCFGAIAEEGEAPPTCTIDARQNHPIDHSGLEWLQGIGSQYSFTGYVAEPIGVAVEFPAWMQVEKSGVTNPACWALTETGTGLEEPWDDNFVRSVTYNAQNNRCSVKLDRPVSDGAWTTLRYRGGGRTLHYAALPADVNASRTSNSSDITKLIDCLNQAPSCTYQGNLYRLDMNRSGVANATDVTSLIDLLNGAQEYYPWFEMTVPVWPEDCQANLAAAAATEEANDANAGFIDDFVGIVSTVVFADEWSIDDFVFYTDAMTGWALDHFSTEERAALARRLSDPTLVFASEEAAEIVKGIVSCLTE